MKKTALVLLLIVSNCVSIFAQSKTSRIDKSLDIFTDVLRHVDAFYADTLNYEKLIETAVDAMLYKIDPYTVYYTPKEQEDLRVMTEGKYGGIGSVVQQRDIDGESHVYIANPYEGKPAQRNGLLAGDEILSVDGISAKGKKVSEVSQLLRGLPGSEVKIVVKREGVEKPIEKVFLREDINMEAVDYYCALDSVGYISFREFTEHSSSKFAAALDELYYQKHIKSLIIDLRNNGGGLISEAIRIVNLFVGKDQTIVTTKGKIKSFEHAYITQADARFPDLPVVVLVNGHSASASEILAGSLQDLGRATLIGERTFGKGLVQNIRPIVHGGNLKITTAKYYLPSGRCIQAIDYAERQKGHELKRDTAGGILPDIVLSDSSKLDICYSLYTKHHFFDYATRYFRSHTAIAAPEQFTLSDEDLEDFCRYLDEQNYVYETETSKYLSQLLDMAKDEDLDSAALASLQAIAPMFNPDFRTAIERNKEEVKQMLGDEIIQRYYYQKGHIAYQLRFDKEVKRAIDYLKGKDTK